MFDYTFLAADFTGQGSRTAEPKLILCLCTTFGYMLTVGDAHIFLARSVSLIGRRCKSCECFARLPLCFIMEENQSQVASVVLVSVQDTTSGRSLFSFFSALVFWCRMFRVFPLLSPCCPSPRCAAYEPLAMRAPWPPRQTVRLPNGTKWVCHP